MHIYIGIRGKLNVGIVGAILVLADKKKILAQKAQFFGENFDFGQAYYQTISQAIECANSRSATIHVQNKMLRHVRSYICKHGAENMDLRDCKIEITDTRGSKGMKAAQTLAKRTLANYKVKERLQPVER